MNANQSARRSAVRATACLRRFDLMKSGSHQGAVQAFESNEMLAAFRYQPHKFFKSTSPLQAVISTEHTLLASKQWHVWVILSRIFRSVISPFAISLSIAFPAFAKTDDAAGMAFFEQKIRPVLVEHCYSCHSQKSEKLRANLLLDSKAGWVRGGDSGSPAIVPLQPEQSPLISSVRHLDLQMPPDKPKLPESVIADLMTWVRMGAPDPRDGEIELKKADKNWWSLQPLSKHQDGASASGKPTIDQFIEKKLSELGLEIGPPADPRTLIRRMYYDLVGLPPTPEEVTEFTLAFQNNPSDAKTNLIERLLASPHYGERWGRHWLDVVRFGESFGFERNVINDDIWPFRDYVIQSINADKPFNQFIIEHIAGDIVGKGLPEIEVGSAFLVAGPYDDVGNSDPVAAANIRAATLDDPITAIGGAFLGLTVNCARCHHHKFDPIPTEDYYRIRAALEGVTHGRRPVATAAQQQARADALKPLNQEKADWVAKRNDLEKVILERAKRLVEAPKRPKIDVVQTEETFAPVEARFLKFVMHASSSNPKSAVGSKLTEFQVWTGGTEARNIALASNGTVAFGERSATAEDFADAYGPQLVIDGVLGEQWFVGAPAVLRLQFSKTERIQRIAFSNDKGIQQSTDNSRGATPTDYEILTSLDGELWTTVASSADREPWTEAHAVERLRSNTISADEKAAIAKIESAISALDATIRKVPALQEIWVGKHETPKVQTFVQKGGDPTKPLEPVAPSGLAVLDHVLERYQLEANADQGERRLALAKWIASDNNPLTVRVLANRVWQYHFGTGIVDTPSDFGFQGSRPSHPELLDYLAGKLLANGWKLKALHREILSSRVYAQASNANDANFEMGNQLDKSSRMLWRFPPRRLDAEEIRDTLLKTTGNLDVRLGGPGFRLYKFTQNNVCTYFPLDRVGPETYRRSVYHQNARASVVDILSDFDLPDTSFAAPKRANTTSPMQALTMLNHSFVQEMANSLSERARRDFPNDIAGQIRSVFSHLLQRIPSKAETVAAAELIGSFGFNAFCRALLNSNELIFVE